MLCCPHHSRMPATARDCRPRPRLADQGPALAGTWLGCCQGQCVTRVQNEQQLSLANKANESALAYQEEVLKNTLNETKQLRDQLRSLKEEKVESRS